MLLDFLFSQDHGQLKKDHHGVSLKILIIQLLDIDGPIGGEISKTEETLLHISDKDGQLIEKQKFFCIFKLFTHFD